MGDLPLPENPALFLMELRRRDFPAFLVRAWPHVCGGQFLQHNWHIDAIAYRLETVARGDTQRLIVNLPPRNGKSIIISVAWIAWMLGLDPSRNFVCVSYSNELSAKLARDCLSIMQSTWYREPFPKTIISQRRSAAHDFETTRGGGRLSTSTGGTLTGRGGDILVLDDLIKPENAQSESARDAVNAWFGNTLISRLNDKNTGKIICVMQRLHQYDLTGMLKEHGIWDHLSIPAIAPDDATFPLIRGKTYHRKEGEVLHPDREPKAVLDELKISMGSAAFSAQYQQDPIPEQGNIFKQDWLKTIPGDIEAQSSGYVVQSWDTGIKTGQSNDWSVCITARMSGKRIYILDIWRGRLEFPDLVHQVTLLTTLHRATSLLIEDKASGQQLIQTLRSEEPRAVPSPIACMPSSDKISRAQGTSSMIEAGQLYLPAEAAWLTTFKSELLAFPNGRYDDQVDALTQLLEWARDRWQEPVPTNVGPELITADTPIRNVSFDDWLEALDRL